MTELERIERRLERIERILERLAPPSDKVRSLVEQEKVERERRRLKPRKECAT